METILELLSQRWLIHGDTVKSYLPLGVAVLNGLDVSGSIGSSDEEKKRQKPYVINIGAESGNLVGKYDLGDPSIPDNSIAVIPIQGVIYPEKSMNIHSFIRQAASNDKIIAAVFPVNSPGGTVFYTDILADSIKNFPKPTISVTFNMSASAAMWLISSVDYRFATSKMDWIGSIGVMVSIMDFRGMFEKLGIVEHEIYADKSDRKNEMIRKLFQDQPDDSVIKADLNFVNDVFHSTIMQNLGISADSEVFSGAIFTAERALQLGLINEINTLDHAFEYAYNQGLIHKAKIQYSSFKQSN